MKRRLTMLLMATGLGIAASLAGCQGSVDESAPPAPPTTETDRHDPHDGHGHTGQSHQGHDHAADTRADGEHAEQLAQLSAADRELAERQRICPVSGEPLGSMGVPVKVTVRGRDVLLCCQGCEAQLKEDPEKYLANLPDSGP